MRLEPMRDLVKVLLAKCTNETLWLHVVLDLLLLVTQLTECVNDQTLNRLILSNMFLFFGKKNSGGFYEKKNFQKTEKLSN